jgi:hypothetical protein
MIGLVRTQGGAELETYDRLQVTQRNRLRGCSQLSGLPMTRLSAVQ